MRLRSQLLPHQEKAVEKLVKIKVGALFMEQGTGKTITALELCRIRMERGKVDRILWLCPCSAKENIKQEILKHAAPEMLSKVTICGIESLSSSVRVNAYLINLVRNARTYLVVDESLLVKNPRAYRTENILRIAGCCDYRLILNGTPVSKNEADLFSQFYLLDWRILGYQSYWSFAANHLEYDPRNPKRVIRCLNKEHLARKIAPYTYQVKKADCLDLPKKIWQRRYFDLTEDQANHYNEAADHLLFALEETKPETIYRLFSGLQAVICGGRVRFAKKAGYEHTLTSPFFADPLDDPRFQCLLQELPEEKSIVFCSYAKDVRNIANHLNQTRGAETAVMFDGSVTQRKRFEAIEQFRDKSSYLIANRNCAGYSLNLQFCHNIVYYSNTWDLATRLQSEDRVHRIGQEEPIAILDICAENTLDERILDCLFRKESMLEAFRDKIAAQGKNAMRDWLGASKAGRERILHTLHDCSDLLEMKGEE